MNRYLVFFGPSEYPAGGMDDFHCAYDSLDEAIQATAGLDQDWRASMERDCGPWEETWAHILDVESGQIVYRAQSEEDREMIRLYPELADV